MLLLYVQSSNAICVEIKAKSILLLTFIIPWSVLITRAVKPCSNINYRTMLVYEFFGRVVFRSYGTSVASAVTFENNETKKFIYSRVSVMYFTICRAMKIHWHVECGNHRWSAVISEYRTAPISQSLMAMPFFIIIRQISKTMTVNRIGKNGLTIKNHFNHWWVFIESRKYCSN